MEWAHLKIKTKKVTKDVDMEQNKKSWTKQKPGEKGKRNQIKNRRKRKKHQEMNLPIISNMHVTTYYWWKYPSTKIPSSKQVLTLSDEKSKK